jgi:hypothetical protein
MDVNLADRNVSPKRCEQMSEGAEILEKLQCAAAVLEVAGSIC